VKLYAESSAVLSWLLEEDNLGEVGDVLSRAAKVFASELTLLECDRVLIRAAATGQTTNEAAEARRKVLHTTSESWTMIGMGQEIIERARQSFPIEPVRTLDAIHIATALIVAERSPGLVILSGDHRVRDNAAALGLTVLP
jgi:predicted nucleic acid-binding protein